MSEGETLLLGLIAGGTIVLGLPLGRMRNPRPGLSQFLNSVTVGILIFLLWDVLAHAWEPIDAALVSVHEGDGGMGDVFRYGSLFFTGIALGLLSLVYYERWLGRPVLAEADEVPVPGSWTAARHLAVLIAIGIGFHNFGEGLAIGGSAANDEVGLATVLVIGFALHNATEGFGIVAPLTANSEHSSWRFLLLMGLIGGGPTFLGTAVGSQFTSDALSVIFLTLAAGSILYVIVQLLGIGFRAGRKDVLYWGLFTGLVAGFVTDMVVTAGGA